MARSDNNLRRVLERVDVDDAGCWNWTGATVHNGYGETMVGARMLRTHRYVYEQLVGPIPAGLHIDHLCRNRLCCNPEHLEPVTQAENNKRSAAARTTCPQGHPYDILDTYGRRRCRTCKRESGRRRYLVKGR